MSIDPARQPLTSAVTAALDHLKEMNSGADRDAEITRVCTAACSSLNERLTTLSSASISVTSVEDASAAVQSLAAKVNTIAQGILHEKEALLRNLPSATEGPMSVDQLKSHLCRKGDVDGNRIVLTQYFRSLNPKQGSLTVKESRAIDTQVQKALDGIATLRTGMSVNIGGSGPPCYLSIGAPEAPVPSRRFTVELTSTSSPSSSAGRAPATSSAPQSLAPNFIPEDVRKAFKALRALDDSIVKIGQEIEPSISVSTVAAPVVSIEKAQNKGMKKVEGNSFMTAALQNFLGDRGRYGWFRDNLDEISRQPDNVVSAEVKEHAAEAKTLLDKWHGKNAWAPGEELSVDDNQALRTALDGLAGNAASPSAQDPMQFIEKLTSNVKTYAGGAGKPIPGTIRDSAGITSNKIVLSKDPSNSNNVDISKSLNDSKGTKTYPRMLFVAPPLPSSAGASSAGERMNYTFSASSEGNLTVKLNDGVKYQLQSFVVKDTSGGVASPYYYTVRREDVEGKEQWVKYDNETVEEMALDAIKQLFGETSSTANPCHMTFEQTQFPSQQPDASAPPLTFSPPPAISSSSSPQRATSVYASQSRGLANPGNSCFMNATIQDFLGNETQYNWLIGKLDTIARGNNSPVNDNALEAYNKLLDWHNNSSNRNALSGLDNAGLRSALTTIINSVSQPCPRFSGTGQHDAHEFRLKLINAVKELAGNPTEVGPWQIKNQITTTKTFLGETNSCSPETKQEILNEMPIAVTPALNGASAFIDIAAECMRSDDVAKGSAIVGSSGSLSACTVKTTTTWPQTLLLQVNLFAKAADAANRTSAPTKFKELDYKFTDEAALTINLGTPSEKYQLQSFVVHTGDTTKSGHYYTVRREKVGGEDKWVEYNDNTTNKTMTTEEMKVAFLKVNAAGCTPYLLTFEKVGPATAVAVPTPA